MSKSKLTEQEELAELEYYEKTGRRERWTNIGHMFGKLQERISRNLKEYCNMPNEERGEEYLSRVREERALLFQILEGLNRLNSTVLEGVAKYTAEEPKRPNWLP